MSSSVHNLTGNLYVNSGTGVVYADGGGLMSNTVKFDSINRGTPGYVALYKDANPNSGVLTGGMPKSMTPLPGALVQWDASGDIDGVTIIGGDITANTISATTINSDSVLILVPPTLPAQAATVEYVDNAISTVVGGFNWQELVINFSDPPIPVPADGDRYVALSTIGPWTKNNIYEWDAGTGLWVETIVVDGMAVTSLNGDPITPIGGPASYIYTSGTGWLLIGFNGMHDNLVGKKSTNSVSSDTVLVAAGTTNGVVYSWGTSTNKVWTGVIELVGASNSAAGHAHFTWRVTVQNHLGVATFSTSNSSTSVAGNLATATASLAIKVAPDDEFLDIRVTTPLLVTSYWHATFEGTYALIVVP
jgi:hypothetical protein